MSDRAEFFAYLNEDFEKQLGHWGVSRSSGKTFFRQGGNERYIDVAMDSYLPTYAFVEQRGAGMGYVVALRHELPAFWTWIEQKNAEAAETLFKELSKE